MKKTVKFQKIMATITTLAMIFSLLTPAFNAEAATYTVGNQSLAINEGMATLTVNGTKTIQLTRSLVTKDGGIDQSTGIVYLLWMSNNLYAYSYDLQKNNDKVNLFLIDSGVVSLTTNGSAITGYDISSGHKSLLTIEQMKERIGSNSSDSNSGSGSGSSSSGDSGSGNGSGTGDSGSGTTTGISNIKVVDNVVTFTVTENGTTKTITLPTAGVAVVDKVGVDKYDTVWVKYVNGQLDVYNRSWQSGESQVKLYTVTKKATALVDANGIVIGYYISGNSTMQKIFTKQDFEKKFFETKSSTYVKYHTVKAYQYDRAVYDSKNKRQDILTLKKNKQLKYHGKVVNKCKEATFNKKGHVICRLTNGKAYKLTYNSKTKKVTMKKICKDAKKLHYYNRSFADYIERKNGKKINVRKL